MMNDYKKVVNGYTVMAFIGFVMAMLINHITHREYIIGLFHGAGLFMFFYGVIANAVVAVIKARKEQKEAEKAE